MKTLIKTSIKGFENLQVKESTDAIYEALTDKHPYIKVTIVSHDKREINAGIKKTAIRLFKQS